MFLIITFLLTLFFLTGTFFLTALSSAFFCTHKSDANLYLNSLGRLFFYRKFHRFFFPNREYEGVVFATICAQNLTRFFYAAFAVIFTSHTPFFEQGFNSTQQISFYGLSWFWLILGGLTFLFMSFIVGDYLPRIFATNLPEVAIRLCAPCSSLFMFLVFPLTYVFLRLSNLLSQTIYLDLLHEPSTEGKQEIIEIIQKADRDLTFDAHDKKLIESVLTFKEHIVREVMVPRVDVFSLSAEISIKEASKLLENEGYSRIPIHRNNLDNIVGVLMYKDVLNKYIEYEQKGGDLKVLEAPISSLQKAVFHAPETTKISHLLQEFRRRQVHLAIIVDEYGGTAGIVTIEDILEEIVGEIADEYDTDEKALFHAKPGGGWIVDARMNILDAEDFLGIEIPQEAEYDTIGGYVFHTAGKIPSKGFVIHHDNFEMEIIESNDRCVDTVYIKPVSNRKNKDNLLS